MGDGEIFGGLTMTLQLSLQEYKWKKVVKTVIF